MSGEVPESAFRTLMLAGLDGDASAHRALLKGVSPYLRSYFRRHLLRMGRTAADGEDLVQETLITIHVRRSTYDRSQPLTPWVYAIARHRLLDHWRRTRTSVRMMPLGAAEEVAFDPDACAVESNLDVEKLMRRLSPKTRQAIRGMKLEGLTAIELAARTGASPSAVKVSVHRGLRALSFLVKRKPP